MSYIGREILMNAIQSVQLDFIVQHGNYVHNKNS